MTEKTTIPAPFLTEIEKDELEMAKQVIINQRKEKYAKAINDLKWHSTNFIALENHLPEDLKLTDFTYVGYLPKKLLENCKEYIMQYELKYREDENN